MSLTATSPRVSRLRISRATPKLPDPMSRTGSYLSMMPSRAPAAGGGALACRGYAAAGWRQGTRRERRKEVGEPRARRGGAGRGELDESAGAGGWAEEAVWSRARLCRFPVWRPRWRCIYIADARWVLSGSHGQCLVACPGRKGRFDLR
jgi:hypothetical protein